MKNEIDYLKCKKGSESIIPADLTTGDIFFSNTFLSLWTFLCTHGERHIFNKDVDKAIGKKKMHGRCIGQAQADIKKWNTKNLSETHPNKLLEYAEGICSSHFVTLHAWSVIRSTRHLTVFDRTWELDLNESKQIWYQGVVFNNDFFNWIRTKQIANNFKDTLPHLTSGCCCLTYKPLLNGELADYPIKDGDVDRAIEMLAPFYNAMKS